MESPGQPDAPDFVTELAGLLNSYSMENLSNTPDFILARYMMQSLAAFQEGIKHREEWYGVAKEPGGTTGTAALSPQPRPRKRKGADAIPTQSKDSEEK